MATAQEIQKWFELNPGASDATIYAAMQANSVTPEQIQQAMGGNLAGYQNRFNAQAPSAPVGRSPIEWLNPTSPPTSPTTGIADALSMAQKATTYIPAALSAAGALTSTPSVITNLAAGAEGLGLSGALGSIAPVLGVANFLNTLFTGRAEERSAKLAAQRAEYLKNNPWAAVNEVLQSGNQSAFDTSVPYEVSAATGWQVQDMGKPAEVARKVANEELKPWQNPDGSWVALDKEGYITPYDPAWQQQLPSKASNASGGGGGGDVVDLGNTGLEPDYGGLGGASGPAGGAQTPTGPVAGDSTTTDGTTPVTPPQSSSTAANPKNDARETGVLDRPGQPAPKFVAPTTREGWLQVAVDWLSRFPNTTAEEARAAASSVGMPSDVVDEAIGNGGTGGATGTNTNTGVSGVPQMPSTPSRSVISDPSRPSAGPTGTGGGIGGGDGTGTGSGTGSGSGGLLFGSPTRTSETVFPELYKNTQKFTLLTNLLKPPYRGF